MHQVDLRHHLQQLAAFGKSEFDTWGKVVKEAGIKPQ